MLFTNTQYTNNHYNHCIGPWKTSMVLLFFVVFLSSQLKVNVCIKGTVTQKQNRYQSYKVSLHVAYINIYFQTVHALASYPGPTHLGMRLNSVPARWNFSYFRND